MSVSSEMYERRGRTVVDRDGEKVGKLDEIYVDRESDQPEWALVNTGLFGMKSSFVPLAGVAAAGDDVRVAYAKDQIKGAPSIDADGELSEQEEAELYRHYGLEYSESGSDSGQSQDRTGGRTGGEDAMTRSEEELRVGTRKRERGRVRLRKYVVTENATQTVPVRREEVRVEREPITDANVDQALQGTEISEGEHEVVLHDEEPVVETRAVPKERVRLDTDTTTEQREISEEVRKERIDVDDDRR